MPHLKETQLILASADDRLAGMIYELADLVLLKLISFVQLRDLAAHLQSKRNLPSA